MISAKKATLHELQTVYGIEDVYDMLEIITVDGQNRRILNKLDEERQRRD